MVRPSLITTVDPDESQRLHSSMQQGPHKARQLFLALK